MKETELKRIIELFKQLQSGTETSTIKLLGSDKITKLSMNELNELHYAFIEELRNEKIDFEYTDVDPFEMVGFPFQLPVIKK